MDTFKEMILLSEIVLQAKIARKAAERLEIANDNCDRVEVWSSIQSILVAAANVSKILWNHKYKARCEELRQLLKVEKGNPLANRKFRNHFEHYDERIEEYFESNTQGVYIDLAMNPSFNCEIFGDQPVNTHRGYNSFNNTLIFRDEILDLNLTLQALDEIYKNCTLYVLT